MPIYQAYNRKIKAWVKYHFVKDKNGKIKAEFLDVKQREPMKPFRGIPKRGNRK